MFEKNWSFQLKLEGIGLSLINRTPVELCYITLKGVSANFIDTKTSQIFNFSIKWLQIDNQMCGALEPIFFYPSVIPKNGQEDLYPVVMATISRKKVFK